MFKTIIIVALTLKSVNILYRLTYIPLEMIIINIIFKFIIGTVLGSFLSLSLIRHHRHESIIWPRSHCDNCNHQLSVGELIPIISYTILKGRCSVCHHPINPIHLINEIFTGLIVAFNFNLSWNGLINTIFQLILLLLANTDFETLTMPTSLISTLLLTGLISIMINQPLTLLFIIVNLILYLLISWINHVKPLIGNGDIDIIFILIIKNGLTLTSIIILAASIMGLIKLIYSHNKLIPFIPYLFLTNFILTNFF